MYSVAETNRRIRELADAEGRNGLTIRHVDPATLKPAAPLAQAPSVIRVAAKRLPAGVRLESNERRQKVITYLDSLNGERVQRGQIADATGLTGEQLHDLLPSLAAHGIIQKTGGRGTMRYWRPVAGSPVDTAIASVDGSETISAPPAIPNPPHIEPPPPVGSPAKPVAVPTQHDAGSRAPTLAGNRIIDLERENAELRILLRIVANTTSGIIHDDVLKVIRETVRP